MAHTCRSPRAQAINVRSIASPSIRSVLALCADNQDGLSVDLDEVPPGPVGGWA
jgi:hypothetical protein